jgi:hypothetical protein
MLKAGHQIIGVAHDDHVASGLLPSPAFSPDIEYVVQVDVAEERRDHRTLSSSAVSYGYDSVFEDARLEPFADQADDALVADTVFQEADQPIMVDAAGEVPDVGVKYVIHLPAGDRPYERATHGAPLLK